MQNQWPVIIKLIVFVLIFLLPTIRWIVIKLQQQAEERKREQLAARARLEALRTGRPMSAGQPAEVRTVSPDEAALAARRRALEEALRRGKPSDPSATPQRPASLPQNRPPSSRPSAPPTSRTPARPAPASRQQVRTTGPGEVEITLPGGVVLRVPNTQQPQRPAQRPPQRAPAQAPSRQAQRQAAQRTPQRATPPPEVRREPEPEPAPMQRVTAAEEPRTQPAQQRYRHPLTLLGSGASRRDLRTAFLMSEVLGPPHSLREAQGNDFTLSRPF